MNARRWVALCAALGITIGLLVFVATPPRFRGSATLEIAGETPPGEKPRSLPVDYIYFLYFVLHDNRLEAVANEFGLYQRERRELSLGDFILKFRDDISFTPLSGDGVPNERFRVSFESDDPTTAMKVSARLASLFVETTEGARTTTRFRLIDPGVIPKTRVSSPAVAYLGAGLSGGLGSGVLTLPLFLRWRRQQRPWVQQTRWAAAGVALGLLVGYAAYQNAPPVYRSFTVLRIPQEGNESIGRVPVIGSATERLRAVTERIVTRRRLEQVAEGLKLYERERQAGVTDAALERVRRSIHVEFAFPSSGDRYYNVYAVFFDANDPRTAMRGAEYLVSFFMEETIELSGRTAHRGPNLVDGAREPKTPISPRLFPYLSLGAFSGVASGLLLALLWRRYKAG